MPLDSLEALEILVKNCDDAYGFPPYHSIKDYLMHPDGADLRRVERGIMSDAFSKLPATLIRSRDAAWWRLIPGFVDESIAIYFPPKSNSIERVAAIPLQADALRR